jgi:transglutaminase-like putative cysteine protease
MLARHCAVASCLFLFLLLAFACGCVLARGSDSGVDPAVVVDHHIQHYVVEPGGGYRLAVDHLETIVEARAIQAHGQYAITYNNTLDTVEALDAYTLKPDGRQVPVQATQVKDQQEAASRDAPMFQDTRVKVVVFPEVAVGDRLAVRYVLRRTTPLFPGHFEDLTPAPLYLNKNFLLIYDMPLALPLYADAVGFVPAPGTGPPGYRRYQWRYVNGDHGRNEADAVSPLDYGKRLAVSTFSDYQVFAAAFRTGAAERAAPSPAIAALARQLTAGLPDTRTRVLALSDWIRNNIRYVGVYIGPGGVVPHPASVVLDNRYGDCKDHAGLLEAMLAALGIDSSGALVNSGNAYKLPGAPTLGVFDHMITYVPGLDLFLDPTAEAAPAGYLPAAVLGKPVLLLRTGGFAMTPLLQPQRVRTEASVDIGRDGRASFRVERTTSGALAEPLRRAVRAARPGEREQFAQRLLQGTARKGTGVFDAGLVDGNGDDYTMAVAGSGDQFLALPGTGALATTYPNWSVVGDAVGAMTKEPVRRQDFVCPAVDAEDEMRFRLPQGVRILALPPAVDTMSGGIFYRARYARAGNAVTVTRRLTFRHGSPTCTPADHRAMQPVLERIQRDLRSQIVVKG